MACSSAILARKFSGKVRSGCYGMHCLRSCVCLNLITASLIAGRATLKEVFQDYLDLLPQYQEIDSLEGVTCLRPFFGFVPNWIESPLKPITSRLLHVGDSAGNRSQLSFAGEPPHQHLTSYS